MASNPASHILLLLNYITALLVTLEINNSRLDINVKNHIFIILKPPVSLAIYLRHVTLVPTRFKLLLIFVSTSSSFQSLAGCDSFPPSSLCGLFFWFIYRSIDLVSLLPAEVSASRSYPLNLFFSLPQQPSLTRLCTVYTTQALCHFDTRSSQLKLQQNSSTIPLSCTETNVQRDLGVTSSWPWSQKMETPDILLPWVNPTFAVAGGHLTHRD